MARSAGTVGPTLAVIARAAGVSVPTVSKVANGREDVAPETRRRVVEVLDRLGYVRRTRGGTRPPALVDLVVHSLESPWSGAVLHGAEQAAHDAGLEVAGTALRMLLELMRSEAPKGIRTELSTRLVVRASTAPPLNTLP